MNGEISQPIERFRSYLLLLARMQMAPVRAVPIEASDIVQQTLLEAHQNQPDFGDDVAGLAAWLRQVLSNNIRDAVRRETRQERDARRVVSLESLSESKARLAACLSHTGETPSHRMVRCEELVQLADCLLQLPLPQREAITLHHLQEWTLAEIAIELGRSEAAVAGLLHRGLRQLRKLMELQDSESDLRP